MATDQKEERASLLRDMNGNSIREGDLVMVLLEKPVLVGFVSEIKEPSVLTSREKNPPGVITVTGTIKIPFAPNQLQILRQTAKLVDPRSEALIDALTKHAETNTTETKLPSSADLDRVAEEKEAGEKTTGLVLVPNAPVES